MNRIRTGRFTRSAKFASLSLELQDLISKLFKVREEERLSVDQVLEHPWMKVGLVQQDEKHANEGTMEVEKEDMTASISISRRLFTYIPFVVFITRLGISLLTIS